MPYHPLPYITSDQTFPAIFECEPITVYAWVDLKRELEPIKPVIADLLGGKP